MSQNIAESLSSSMSNGTPDHYKSLAIDVITFCMANNLDFMQGNIIKYICRYRKKNGIEDLKKARNYIDRLIAFEEQRVQ